MTCESVYVASAGGWVNRNDCKGTPTCGMRLTYGGPAVTFADPFPDPSEIPDSYPALTLEELMTKYMKWSGNCAETATASSSTTSSSASATSTANAARRCWKHGTR